MEKFYFKLCPTVSQECMIYSQTCIPIDTYHTVSADQETCPVIYNSDQITISLKSIKLY